MLPVGLLQVLPEDANSVDGIPPRYPEQHVGLANSNPYFD